MDTTQIFGLQLTLSVVIVALLAHWLVAPWLAGKSRRASLFWLTLPHVTRHVGLVFLVPGIVSTELPQGFADAAGYGDLLAALLALLTLVALQYRWAIAIPLAWVFNVIGTADLVNALRQAEVIPHLGFAWFIPTFWVPVLLVSHVMIFSSLLGLKTTACQQSNGILCNRPTSSTA